MKRLLCLALVCAVPSLMAAMRVEPAVDNEYDAIEEDWELVLGTPDVDSCGPQITTTMSPVGDTKRQAMSFNLNYRDDPFRTGGMQLRAWYNGEGVNDACYRTDQLQTPNETITWTQSLRLSAGVLTFSIKGGQSTTWGSFAGDGDPMQLAVTSSLSSLAKYSVAESAANSGPGWQSNRVTRMRLLRVRYYRGGELDHTDNTVRTVVGSD